MVSVAYVWWTFFSAKAAWNRANLIFSLNEYGRYKGEGNDVQFKYLDFEAATEGEYWLIFRGFLLLHRDAAAGRFAVDRTAGIGSHVNRLALGQREQADLDVQNTLHQGKFNAFVLLFRNDC